MSDSTQFVENQQYYGMEGAGREVGVFDMLRKDMERVVQLAVKEHGSIEALQQSFLRVGSEVLALPIGIVSRISHDQKYTIEALSGQSVGLRVEHSFDLHQTYCCEVYNRGEVMGGGHAGSVVAGHYREAYELFGFESYLSAPIFIDGDIYGSLAFFSSEARDKGFSLHEKEMAALLGRLLGRQMQSLLHEQSLKALNERLYRLVGYVAHDIRNPIGVIKGLSQMLHDKASDETRRKHFLSRITMNADRCLEFVHSVLNVAALSAGKITLHPKSLLLSPLLDESLQDYESVAQVKSLEIKINVSGDARIYGDAPRLYQAFTNLLSNALKFAPINSEILINANVIEDGQLEIEIINRLERDQDLLASSSDFPASIGFGLDIVREIVELHGSRLVHGEHGECYVARFRLPVVG